MTPQSARVTRVAILGAPGTGKTSLAQALSSCALVPHTWQIDTACGLSATVLQELQSGTQACYADALQDHTTYTLSLLMSVDNAHATALAFDQRMRALLQTHGIPFVVIYGQGQARIDQAREAIAYQCNQHDAKRSHGNSQWQWNCEKCSDAQCEHRIFSALMETRSMRA